VPGDPGQRPRAGTRQRGGSGSGWARPRSGWNGFAIVFLGNIAAAVLVGGLRPFLGTFLFPG
jgi:hypothetical protein